MDDIRCIMCGTSGDRLCSYACVEAATREQDRNVTWQHQLDGHAAAAERRSALSRRNGEITAALMAWRHAESDA